MSDLIPSSVLLAILQNQIKNLVDENKVDTSKFAIVKTIGDASALTAEEKNDISKNAYQFLIDRDNDLYVLNAHHGEDDWSYYNFSDGSTFIIDNHGFRRIYFRKDYLVGADINGDVIFTDVITDDDYPPPPDNVSLQSSKYQGVLFHGNYLRIEKNSAVYRFSSGIILDSSTGTPQYKIVLATYDVNVAKVTFVEKVLPWKQ